VKFFYINVSLPTVANDLSIQHSLVEHNTLLIELTRKRHLQTERAIWRASEIQICES